MMQPKMFYCGDDVYSEGHPQTITILAEEHSPEESGILDAEGRMLYRYKERNKVGFI